MEIGFGCINSDTEVVAMAAVYSWTREMCYLCIWVEDKKKPTLERMPHIHQALKLIQSGFENRLNGRYLFFIVHRNISLNHHSVLRLFSDIKIVAQHTRCV